MALSPYIRDLRTRVGSARLLLPSVSVHVFDDAGRLLLVQQRDGNVWSTPGGLIEPDERPADAARREAWEETGLVVRVERLAGVYGGPECVVRYPNGDEAQYVIIAFECVIESGVLRPDCDETVAVQLCSPAEASALPLAPWLRSVLPIVYARGAAPGFQAGSWRAPEPGAPAIEERAR
jgi:8-oxo-dGTP pyrophosphatase MutT (NUDIX family)